MRASTLATTSGVTSTARLSLDVKGERSFFSDLDGILDAEAEAQVLGQQHLH